MSLSPTRLGLYRTAESTPTEYIIKRGDPRVDYMDIKRFQLAPGIWPQAAFCIDAECRAMVGVSKRQLTCAFSNKTKAGFENLAATLEPELFERVNTCRSKLGLPQITPTATRPSRADTGGDTDSDDTSGGDDATAAAQTAAPTAKTTRTRSMAYQHVFPHYRQSQSRRHSDIVPIQVLPLVLLRLSRRPFCTDSIESFTLHVALLRAAIAALPATVMSDSEKALTLAQYDCFSRDRTLWQHKYQQPAAAAAAEVIYESGPLTPIMQFDDDNDDDDDDGDGEDISSAKPAEPGAAADGSPGAEPSALIRSYKVVLMENAQRIIADAIKSGRSSMVTVEYDIARPAAVELLQKAKASHNVNIVLRKRPAPEGAAAATPSAKQRKTGKCKRAAPDDAPIAPAPVP
jgi:hypothetical protein